MEVPPILSVVWTHREIEKTVKDGTESESLSELRTMFKQATNVTV